MSRVVSQPAVFVRPDIDKILSTKLKDIVKRHHGHLVERPEDATHIVHRPPNYRDEGKLQVASMSVMPTFVYFCYIVFPIVECKTDATSYSLDKKLCSN